MLYCIRYSGGTKKAETWFFDMEKRGEANREVVLMKLHLETDSGVTIIENSFIDRYMPGANGEYVKLYLYLLRCAGAGKELSISSIADFFDHTEKDIRRALAYWEKLDVLKVQYDDSGNVSDIMLCCADSETISSPADSAGSSPGRIIPITHGITAVSDDALPSRRSLSPSRKRELKEQEDIRQLFFVAETYLGRALTASEGNNLLYFYDSLHFSADLIEYLLEYCALKGNPGAKYMERVACGWYEKGISTVADAKKETISYHREYYQIFEALGMKGRTPAPKEAEYMDRWLKDWAFSMDIILEACSRTIMLTSRPSIRYADGILKSWHESNVQSLEDIRSLDEAFASRSPQPGRKAVVSRAGTPGRFGNFTQREYNYDNLEQQLLAAQAVKGEIS